MKLPIVRKNVKPSFHNNNRQKPKSRPAFLRGRLLVYSIPPYFSVFYLLRLLLYIRSSSYTARIPPIYLHRVLAHTTWASPIFLRLILTGTATSFRCMPIRVSPISMPADALICSTATGCEKRFQAAVAKEPPALGECC